MHNAITANCYHYTTHSPCTCNVHSSSHPLIRSPSPPPPCSSHVLLPGGKPKTHTSHPPRATSSRTPAPSTPPAVAHARQLSNSPTSQQVEKLVSRKVGKCPATPLHPALPRPRRSLTCTLHPLHSPRPFAGRSDSTMQSQHRWSSHGHTGTPCRMGSTSKPANNPTRSTLDHRNRPPVRRSGSRSA